MGLTIILPAGSTLPRDSARTLEEAVRHVLPPHESYQVRFGTCTDDEGAVRFVCKVEGPPADPFSDEPQWRWWSPIVSDAQELKAALSAAVRRRYGAAFTSVEPESREQAAAR